MIVQGTGFIAGLGTLGSVEQQEVWDEAKQIYTYTKGDQSILMLLYGVTAILLTVLMIFIWRGTLKSAYKAECLRKEGKHVNTFLEDLKSLLHENLYRLFMTPPTAFVFVFTILPLVFMICMAFTNYSRIDNHLMLFDWVGLENFKTLFDSGSILGSTFWSVLVWTVVWAFFATFSNYIFGMILSLLINRKGTRAKGFWRFCFVLSCAVPMFVSLLIMRTMLQPEGAVNVLLRNLGLIAGDASLPFFTNPTWARVTVIIINIWVGVPYTLLQLTGVLQNIPEDLYEAARVDGANKLVTFVRIVLPLVAPGIVATAIYTFINAWNEFLYSLILINSTDLMTVSVALKSLQGAEILDWGSMMAASTIVVIPSVIFFTFIQRYIAGGMTEGSVK